MAAKYPETIQYEEYADLLLLANSKPFTVGGTRRFIQILETEDDTDSTEFSLDDGQSWTRLRKGICPFFATTEGLKLRNPTAGDVLVSIATGTASFEDRRLVINPLAGTIPVDITASIALAITAAQLPAALSTDGKLKVEEPDILTTAANFGGSIGTNDAVANAEKQILAIAAGTLKVVHAVVREENASGNGDCAYLYAKNAGGQLIILASHRGDSGPTPLSAPIQLPGGFGLFMKCSRPANASWWQVGFSREGGP